MAYIFPDESVTTAERLAPQMLPAVDGNIKNLANEIAPADVNLTR